jgi:Tol biopolymer transport system component
MRATTTARIACWLLITALAAAGCSKSDSPTRVGLGDRPSLRIAFLSERPPSPAFSSDIYFYDVAAGGPAYRPPNVSTTNADGPCALSADGRKMAFWSNRLPIGTVATLLLYDVATGAVSLPHWASTLDYPNNPSLSADARYLAFQYQVGASDLFVGVEDLVGDRLLPLPMLNASGTISFDPSLSADGSLIAFASMRPNAGGGGWDIFLYSVPGDSLVPLPGINSAYSDLAPSLSGDGRYLAFQSGRPGLDGGVIDVFLYDRQTQSLVPLPGVNTPLADYLPSLSPDGRYLAYTTDSQGGRDIRLYDVVTHRFVDLPGLDDPYFYDYFPAISNR